MGSTRPIEGYIFDLGNVIVDIHVDRFLPALGLDGRWSVEKALGRYEESGVSRDFELGLLSFDEFYRKSCDLFGVDPERHKFLTAWNAIIGDEKAGIYEIIKSCADKAPVYLLSNTNDPHYRYSLERAPSLHLMKEHFLSYKLNVLKPDPRIYIKTIEHIGIPAGHLFFTDDREDNIASAQQVGLHAVQFTNTGQLKNVLRNLEDR
jgi:glucose-1-phosphatase